MAVFNRLKSCPLLQALGAPICVGNQAAGATAPGYLVISWHLLFNFLAEQKNRISNEIKADFFLSAAETKRDELKCGAFLCAGGCHTTFTYNGAGVLPAADHGIA